MRHPLESFYIPLIFWIAATLVAFAQPALKISISHDVAVTMNALAILLLVAGGLLGYRALKGVKAGRGGQGGRATSVGDRNRATGGDGGAANGGIGGNGGDAMVRGNRSTAKGGKGGAG
jgi:hypothetical protein